MSADNWTVCPRCEAAMDATAKQYADEAEKAYGKAPPEEYESLLNKARTPIELKPTLREDYEIGIRDGIFSVSYGCRCNCGLKFTYEHAEKI